MLIKNRTTYEQILPVNLSISGFDKTLLHASTNLKDFLNNYIRRKEIFNLQERHENAILNTSKNFFSNNHIVDIFMFYFLNNLTNINNLDYIFIMQTQKDQNINSKFGFTPSQRGRCHCKRN